MAKSVIYPTPNNFEGGLNEIVSKIKNRKPPKKARINKLELIDNIPFSQVSPEVVNNMNPIKNPNK